MRKLYYILIMFQFLSLPAFSFFTNSNYYEIQSQAELSDGVIWKKLVFDDLFNSKQIINIVEVDLKKAHLKPLQVSGCEKVSTLAKKKGSIAAINGTYFQSNCQSRNFLKVDGMTYSKNLIRSSGSIALLFDSLNAPHFKMIKADEDPSFAINGIGGFPQLLLNGQIDIKPLETTQFFNGRHPRTSVGLLNSGHMVLVTVDGRSVNSRGFTIFELAQFLKDYGVADAMNLDGGISTVLWTESEGIVSKPSSSKGEGRVSDGLGVFINEAFN